MHKNIYADIRYNLIKFISLFHSLFKPVFQKEDDDIYICNKNQIRAIMIMGKSNGITPSILGKCMDMEKGSITSLVESLEKLGLVYKVDDLNDKRKTWIHLTNGGKNYYCKKEKRFLDQIQSLLSNATKEEIESFNLDLNNVVLFLEKIRGDK